MALACAGLVTCARPPPTCSDGVRNGQESDVDCGGPDCGRCELRRACLTPDDCGSGLCRQRVCAAREGPVCLRNADCPGGACVDGVCVGACPPPLLQCQGACVDVRNDPASCGECGRACAPGQRCNAGTCEEVCPPGTLACAQGPGLACVNTSIDVLHCGSCTNVCLPGQRCAAGVCESNCAPFQAFCMGQCVFTGTDPLHCGGCNQPCAPGQVCSMGMCAAACTPPVVVCDGGVSCVDLRFDPLNCGACGSPCPLPPHAQPLCLNQVCGRTACDLGFEDCNGVPSDGCEAELAVDAMNCGVCGRACSPCMNGMCP